MLNGITRRTNPIRKIGISIKLEKMEDYEIKARALVLSFMFLDIQTAKKCAIITCKEVISACEYNNAESYNTTWWENVVHSIHLI